jgi:hypothetical protein
MSVSKIINLTSKISSFEKKRFNINSDKSEFKEKLAGWFVKDPNYIIKDDYIRYCYWDKFTESRKCCFGIVEKIEKENNTTRFIYLKSRNMKKLNDFYKWRIDILKYNNIKQYLFYEKY